MNKAQRNLLNYIDERLGKEATYYAISKEDLEEIIAEKERLKLLLSVQGEEILALQQDINSLKEENEKLKERIELYIEDNKGNKWYNNYGILLQQRDELVEMLEEVLVGYKSLSEEEEVMKEYNLKDDYDRIIKAGQLLQRIKERANG